MKAAQLLPENKSITQDTKLMLDEIHIQQSEDYMSPVKASIVTRKGNSVKSSMLQCR